MTLTINGKGIEFSQSSLTISGLLKQLGIEPARVAVEVNLAIVKKSAYEKQVLRSGDTVEIVNFVGGG